MAAVTVVMKTLTSHPETKKKCTSISCSSSFTPMPCRDHAEAVIVLLGEVTSKTPLPNPHHSGASELYTGSDKRAHHIYKLAEAVSSVKASLDRSHLDT